MLREWSDQVAGTSQGKGHQAGVHLVCPRNREEADVAGVERSGDQERIS